MKTQFIWILFYGVCFRLSQSLPISLENELENEIQTENETFIESYTRRMKSMMNTSVDPCDNFYAYACGNYPNIIEDLESSNKRSNTFDVAFVLNDLVDDILKEIHEPNEEYYDELQIAKKFLDTCVGAKLFPIQPSEEYLEVIKSIGGFPAIDPTWNESTFDWFNMTAHLTRYGVVGMVEENIVPAYPFAPYYKLPKLGFGFDVYLENIATNDSEGYIYNEKVMRSLLQVYGSSGTKADEVIKEIFDLWREIMELQSPLLDENLIRSKCLSLSVRENIGPNFLKWNNLFKIGWDVRFFSVTYISYCPCSWFYNKLDQLAIKKPKAFANYMALKFLFSMHPQLKSGKFQRRQCVSSVKRAMPTLFSHFYMKKHYNKQTDKDISEMILELKISWKNLINSADWLDESAQLEALEKLKRLQSRVGQIVDPISDIYTKQINKLKETGNNAKNILEMAKFKVDMNHYGYLHRHFSNKTAAYNILDAVRVRAFYMQLENNLNIMAGILHPPIYHKDFPNSVKYGSLGYVIGHEIGHGFEEYGLNITSNSTRQSWLSKKSLAIAQRRSRCYIEDYNNFKEPSLNMKLNGNIAISEIQADSLGLRQALTAYRRVLKYGVKHNGEDFLRKEYLPKLNVSLEQTFFLSFAQMHCFKYEAKDYWSEVKAKHPLNRYRVMGTLRNFDEFSKAYNCPAESPMNPTEKCRLW